MFVHLCIAQSNAEFGNQFWVGLIGVILIAHGISFSSRVCVSKFVSQGCTIAASWWAPIELATAFGYLFFFGAGFFIGVKLIACAALFRLLEWVGLRYETVLTGQTRNGGGAAATAQSVISI